MARVKGRTEMVRLENKARPLRCYGLLVQKDLRLEFHTKKMLLSMGVYSLLVLIVFGVAVGRFVEAIEIVGISGGLLWIMIVFTSLLGLNQSFSHDREESCLEGILLAPVDRGVIFLAKATSNFIYLAIVEIITIPLFYLLFLSGSALPDYSWAIIAPLLLGTVGIALVGTLISTITVHTRSKDIVLAVLFVPLVFPLLYACVSASMVTLVYESQFFEIFFSSLIIAAAYDLIMLVLGWALYDYVIST